MPLNITISLSIQLYNSFDNAGFLPGILSGGRGKFFKPIVIVMLTFLLFSDKFFFFGGGKSLRGAPPLVEEARMQSFMFFIYFSIIFTFQ